MGILGESTRNLHAARLSPGRTAIIGFAFVLLSLVAVGAQAQDCSDYPGGLLDGFAGTVAPSQLQIDRNCTIRNYPASNPLGTNFSFLTQPGQTEERWLIVFDNVVHTGQMACNSVAGHKIWFTNGSSTSIQEGCQNLLIPVEKIDKQNPAGQTIAAVGVPFTYTLKLPVLFDSGTGTVINNSGSLNDLHGVTIWDDLNATGADLSYVGHTAYWLDTGAPVAHTFDNAGGVLTFDNLPIIPAGQQIIIELTVILDNTPANTNGTQFVNTAKWDFGRLVEGVFYEPLPGEWGITAPMTIGGPELILAKTGPATMNLGAPADFTIDIANSGTSDAWNTTIIDRLPDGPDGGMCDMAPVVQSARVYAADGITPVPGKGPLLAGTDFVFSYSSAPACELTLTMLSAASVIGPGERLIVVYSTQLDSDTGDGVVLTNVAGATEWFNGDSSNSGRQTYARSLTDGTVGTSDHQDAHTVTTDLSGLFFEKTVANLASGANPATRAAPGDTLRYTLRVQTTDTPLNGVTIYDDLGALNASAVFQPGTLALVAGSIPPGADTSNTNPVGGTNGAGILDVRNLSLAAFSELTLQFDITLQQALLDATVVLNQAELRGAAKLADSDDPNINGQANPEIDGDEDPTRIVIEAVPPPALVKANTQATAAIGEVFDYLVTVPATPHSAPLFDVRIVDDLVASAADLEFVAVTKVSGGGTWTPVNTGTATGLVIEDTSGGIDIPAGEQAVIAISVRLADTATNVAGLTFTNTAAYTYNQLDNNAATQLSAEPGTSGPMTVVEPELVFTKIGPPQMRIGLPGTFTLDAHNTGTAPAYAATITDLLPDSANGGMCDAAPAQVTAQLFEADGVTPVAPPLAAGTDFTVSFDSAACTFVLTLLTPAAAIGPDQRLIISYQASLDADTQGEVALTNIAGATGWHSADISVPGSQSRHYQRALTDGTVGVTDHEDAHTVLTFDSALIFEKTVSNVSTGSDPATVATPGDRLRYRLRIENANDAPLSGFSIVDELDALNAVPAFRPGTLTLITVPAGADSSGTDAGGGAAGTGLLDIANLSLGGLGDTLEIEFEVELAAVLANDSFVYNQSAVQYSGFTIALSDDPNVNGAALPDAAGDEDPTRVQIESAPAFQVQKVSSYLSGDPNVLLAGEMLRYTITVQNIGTDHARGVSITDQVPANTSYVAGSTMLNGVAVPDPAAGGSPLADGILVNAPQDATPGNMNAAVADNVATVVFDVVVTADTADGTVLSNQAFVSAADQAVPAQPSDDPRTPVADDPTRDVVGNYPLLFAPKDVALQVDLGSPGIVDPGDVLRYTITVYNQGTVAATAAELADVVPADTTYVADSVTLNGLPQGQPDNGVFPLIDGIAISSADLTPPLPAPGAGEIGPGEAATVQFDLQVNAGVPTGTVIANQALVYSAEVPTLLTDGDGNPATGPEPTLVVVGDAQQLSIIKEVAVIGGGPALPGATLEYSVTVTNVGPVPALYVVITDDLSMPVPGYLSYADQSATLDGLRDGVSVAGTVITADYSAGNGPLPPGESTVLRFRARINPDLAAGTTISNTARATWNDPPQWAEAVVSLDVGAMPDAAMLNGSVWHDEDHDNARGNTERALEDWHVGLYLGEQKVRSTQTDSDGNFVLAGVVPNNGTGQPYTIRFSAPDAGSRTALMGEAESAFTDGLQRIDDIVVSEGSNIVGLNMPADPNGVIYNSVARSPVAGATVTLVDLRNGLPVPGSCFDDPNQQGQVTVANGYYKFDINFSDAACPAGINYLIKVQVPDTSYIAGVSELIPPSSGEGTFPFDVPSCPGTAADAVPATPDYCEAQVSPFAPAPAVPARDSATGYHSFLRLGVGQRTGAQKARAAHTPGTSQLFNNHIPVDPRLSGAVAVTKSTPLLNVTRGQMVPYVIRMRNTFGVDLQDVSLVDRFPAGFRYVEGSARLDGIAAEPVINGRELAWNSLTLAIDETRTIKLLLAIGAGVTEGEFVNRAQAVSSLTGTVMSGEAQATVRLVPDPTFDCTDVTGKVFNDVNRNGYQDDDEPGLPGVRVVTAGGLAARTDAHGRYHVTCAVAPHHSRGSNFVLKLDDRTLPSGFRLAGRPVQVHRATAGKALRINFGASIHHVVGLDVADAVFEPGTVEMRPQWQPRVGLLLEELQKRPSVLRLSYVADIEDEALVERRMKVLKEQIGQAWQELNCCYELVIEPEIFWRLGGPPQRSRRRGK